MARFTHLPIYKKSFQLLIKIEEIVLDMEKRARYTIGADLRNTIRDFVVSIARTNSVREREKRIMSIKKLFDLIQEVYILLSVVKELKLFKKRTHYEFLLEYVFDIEKQLEGWKKSIV